MVTTATLVPVEEYLSAAYQPDCEYVDGRLLERNMGESDHAGLQGLLVAWLSARRKQLGIHVFPERRVQIGPARYRVTDITVTTRKVSGHIPRDPPFLCIEILSSEDRPARTEEKIDEYLKFGVAHIWLIDPRNKRAWSYMREGKREPATTLTTTGPDIRLSILDLFSDLDQEIEPTSEP